MDVITRRSPLSIPSLERCFASLFKGINLYKHMNAPLPPLTDFTWNLSVALRQKALHSQKSEATGEFNTIQYNTIIQ
eukprot:scaffold3646_cov257-Chaetoceros_neogracile.AAC.11